MSCPHRMGNQIRIPSLVPAVILAIGILFAAPGTGSAPAPISTGITFGGHVEAVIPRGNWSL
jgi:hypothetical protein